MSLFNEKTKKNIQDLLDNLINPVKIIFFTQEFECMSCKDTRSFLQEISGFSDKITLNIYDFQKDKEKVSLYNIDKIPAIVLLDENDKDTGIKFYGIPGGYEINSFLHSLLEVSGEKSDLSEDTNKRIKKINKNIHIQVFVTLTCPYCPEAVKNAHRIALENDMIKADMVESSTFNHLVTKYNVSGVPKIVINEKHELVGAQPIEAFLNVIDKLLNAK